MRGWTHRAPALAVPQQHGSSRTLNAVSVCRSDIFPMRCRGAKSFVDDLDWVGVSYLVEQPPHCDLLRLSLMTWRFVRLRRTYFRRGDLATSRAAATAAAAFADAAAAAAAAAALASPSRSRFPLLPLCPLTAGGQKDMVVSHQKNSFTLLPAARSSAWAPEGRGSPAL